MAYRTVHQWTRYRLKGKLKVPRPVSEKQKTGVVEEFKKNSYSGSQKSEVCPMPYALCPMPYALCPVVPHLSEKGYISN